MLLLMILRGCCSSTCLTACCQPLRKLCLLSCLAWLAALLSMHIGNVWLQQQPKQLIISTSAMGTMLGLSKTRSTRCFRVHPTGRALPWSACMCYASQPSKSSAATGALAAASRRKSHLCAKELTQALLSSSSGMHCLVTLVMSLMTLQHWLLMSLRGRPGWSPLVSQSLYCNFVSSSII